MTDNQKSHRGPVVRAVAAVGAAGAAVAASPLTAKARNWLKQLETPAREFTRQHWTLAKAASAAAADTWRNGHSAMRAESVKHAESVQPAEPHSPAAASSAEEARERPPAGAAQGPPPQ